jgi:topoisomerase-4 subunit A
VLRAFLDHRRDVLLRRSEHRIEKIDHRLEVLEGFIIAFLNLDRVIDIIRYDDDPKAALMREDWGRGTAGHVGKGLCAAGPARRGRTDRGAGRGHPEHAPAVVAAAGRDGADRRTRRADEGTRRPGRPAGKRRLQWKQIGAELEDIRKRFGKGTPCGARRTVGRGGEVEEVPFEAMIEREPITVICSKMGWIRAMKGHVDLAAEQKFKDGDGPRFAFHAETTDKILLVAENGRFYTLIWGEPARRARHGRAGAADGRPAERHRITDLILFRPGEIPRGLDAGDGFVVPSEEVVAQTRAGKQVLTWRRRQGRGLPPARATPSPWWATTASCWCSRWPNCRKWRGQGRAAAEIQGRRAVGCHHLHAGGGPVVERPGRAHPDRNRPDRMAGAPRPAPARWPRAAFPRDNPRAQRQDHHRLRAPCRHRRQSGTGPAGWPG